MAVEVPKLVTKYNCTSLGTYVGYINYLSLMGIWDMVLMYICTYVMNDI